MAWLNAQGKPVATQLAQIDVTIPVEAGGNKLTALLPVLRSGDVAAISTVLRSVTLEDVVGIGMNFIQVVIAFVGLMTALSSGNPAAIMAALQALINAITGK